jgi:hypothetical protein
VVVDGNTVSRIGAEGIPLEGEAALTADQQAVVDANRSKSRSAVNKIAAWIWFNMEPD